MARALVNRTGGGQPVLENVYKTKLKRDFISQQYQVIDTTPNSEKYFHFADLEIEPARALANRVADDGRAIINKSVSSPSTGNSGVTDARSLVSKTSTSNRLGNQPLSGTGGGILDARALVNKTNESNRLGNQLPPVTGGGITDARSLVSKTSTSNRISGGGLEDGYEQGDGRAIINRLSSTISSTNPIRIKLTSGKNIIKFANDGPLLKRDQPIDFEVLDSNGNPLYTELTGYQDRLGYYYAIIYVYDTTPSGTGTVSFVGYADYDQLGNKLPPSNKENLIWYAEVEINALERNRTDILFEKSPTISISQVLVPYQFNLGTYALNSRLVTQSLYGLTILNTDIIGYDFDDNKTSDILDQASKDNSYNYFGESITTSTIETNIRKSNPDIINGYEFSEFTRFSTILLDPSQRLTKDMEGSIFSFYNTDGGLGYTSSYAFTPSYTSSYIRPVTDIVDQLESYQAKIVYVLNNKYALLDTPVSVEVYDKTNTINELSHSHIFKKVTNVSGSFIYPTSSLNVITSQNLSSSFIQFTVTDFEPIAGDVYRVKTYVKEAGSNTEYKQLNDHVVVPPEYLIDSDKPNQAAYAKNKSDSFVYGEFTDISVVNDYWRGFGLEADKKLYQYNFNTTSSYPLANAVILSSTSNLKKGLVSRYYQTYIPNQPFSLSFYCALDPGCELEVYMSSTPIRDNAIGIQGPKAFYESLNEDTSIQKAYSKYGKLVGKISNISGSALKTYNNVIFDFFADADGFGRPVFFLNTNSATSKNAYISSISITPLDLVGYTPTILQFAAPVPDSIWILQDDDASLTQSIDVKVEYFNYEGKQSEFTTYIPNVQMNLIAEVPGFCSAEQSFFNDHCPLYYEVTSNGTTNTTAGTAVTKDPKLYNETYNAESPTNLYFWPTYSLNNSNGYYWNIINFGVGTSYNTESLAWHTSSNTINTIWRRFDPIMPVYDQVMPGTNPFPAMYSASLTGIYSKGDDNQLFWKSNGTLISPIDIAQALPTYSSSYYAQQNQSRTNEWNGYLKKTRLYFPTNNETYIYGFNENGGVYNVKFSLKRWPQYQTGKYVSSPLLTVNSISGFPDDFGYFADTQIISWSFLAQTSTRYAPVDGAKLMVYIHDVSTPLVTGSKWQKGTPGFYPPDNNIVTIGNGYSTTPTLRYYDSGSGAYIDTYDIILVQYGDKAQLTFDASGIELTLDTANDGFYNLRHVDVGNPLLAPFWGGMISDIEWCKIGVTTDPKYIKPTNFNDTFIDKPKKGTWVGGGAIGGASQL